MLIILLDSEYEELVDYEGDDDIVLCIGKNISFELVLASAIS